LPNYGSAGGSCDITLEADNSVIDNPDEFQRRVQRAYELARQSVEQELGHHRTGASTGGQSNSGQSNREPEQRQQQQRQDYRSDNSSEQRYGASSKQQDYIIRLVGGIRGLDWAKVDKFCVAKFGKACAQLSGKQASELIDDLKAAKSGGGGLSV
jgi:hypothetical protein